MKATIDQVRAAKEDAEAKINGIIDKFIEDYELTNIGFITRSWHTHRDGENKPTKLNIEVTIKVQI